MLRRIMVLLLCFISCTAFGLAKHGCQQAPATTDGNFCVGFKASAYCHCIENGMDSPVCDDMNQVYNAMIDYFHSLDDACKYGEAEEGGVPTQVCIDDWNCYRNGGANSQGGLCSSTGQACQ